jgi:hypothetical protein
MTTEEYRATLNKLGLSIVASAEHLGLSLRHRSATPTEHHLSPTRSRSSYASPSESASPPTISRPSDLTRTRALVPSSSRQE